MHHPKREFIPAAGVDWLLPLYDPLLRLIGRDALLRRTLIADAEEVSRHGTMFGSLSYYRAHRAADDEPESAPV